MPRLPTSEDYQLRTPRPARDVVNIRPDDAGAGIQKIGQQLGQMVEEETRKLEDMEVQDALVNLSYKDTELALGKDGYLHQPLQAFTSGEVLKKYPEQYQNTINEIGSKIKSARAREAFMLRAKDDMGRFNRSMLGHVSSKVEKAQDVSDKAMVKAAIDRVTSLPTFGNMDRSFRDIEQAHARLSGQVDNATLAYMVNDAKAEAAEAAVGTLLAQKKFTEVEAWLDTYKGVLKGKTAEEIRLKLGEERAFTLGAELGETAIEMHKKNVPPTEIDEYIRSNAGKVNADSVIRSAKTLLTSHKQAVDEAEGEVSEVLYNEFTDGKVIKKSSSRVQDDPRFKTLTPGAKNKLNELMDRKNEEILRESQQNSDRYRATLRDREEAKLNDYGVQEKVNSLLRDTDQLVRMSPVDIRAKEKEFGKAYVGILLKARTDVISDAEKYRAQKADLDAVLAPIKDKKNRARMEALTSLRVDAWKALPENLGKKPDAQTVRQIVANTALILVDEGRLFDDEIYLFKAQQREGGIGKAVLPIKRKDARGKDITVNVPGDFVSEIIEAYPHLRKDQILKMWETEQLRRKK